MAKEDAILAENFYGAIFPSLIAIAIVVIIFCNAKSWMNHFFAWFYTTFMFKDILKYSAPHKEKLFATICEQKSKIESHRKENSIRIVEIGSGPGANFVYFPKKCNLVCYDPNPHFNSVICERCKQYPGIKFEKVVISGAENLVDTEDESVDAVVCTMVLCSVHNIEMVLKEVTRVLVPGGKFFFMEHTKLPGGIVIQLMKGIMHILRKILFQSSHTHHDIATTIKNFKFLKVDITNFVMPIKSPFFKTFICDCIFGIAEK